MLAAGIRVLIYAGDQDLICNWLGNERWVDQLNWVGSDSWIKAEEEVWSVGEEEAGSVRQVGPLSFVKVFGAGHMSPMDKPPQTLHMLTAFTRNKPLGPSGGVPVGTTLAIGGSKKAAGRKEGPAGVAAAEQ